MARGLKYNFLIYLCALWILTQIVFSGVCRFGKQPGCIFPCHCKYDDICNDQTGHCPYGCADGHPSGFPWRGSGCQIGNIAYLKNATQISTHIPGDRSYSAVASKGVDGDIGPNMSDGHCVHTKEEDFPWWKVDLGDLYQINSITIFNRRNEPGRLSEIKFLVSNGTNETVCSDYPDTVPTAGKVKLSCTALARYVRIERYTRYGLNKYILNFCEVVIEGYRYIDCSRCSQCNSVTGCLICPAGKQLPDCSKDCSPGAFGTNCAETCGHCLVNSPCNRYNGSCERGCKQWYTGRLCKTQITSPNGKINVTKTLHSNNSIEIYFWGIANIPPKLNQYYFYNIEYNEADEHKIKRVMHKGSVMHHATINNLTFNTRYKFRIVPYREHADHNVLEAGTPSAGLLPIKTDCIVPGTPSITVDECQYDQRKENIAITVHYTLSSFTGCDTISVVQLSYNMDGGFQYHNITSSEKTTQNVQNSFNLAVPSGTENINVRVYNNEYIYKEVIANIDSKNCVGFDKSGQSNNGSPENLALIIGVVVAACILLLIIIVVVVVLMRRKRRKASNRQSSDAQDKTFVDSSRADENIGAFDNPVFPNDDAEATTSAERNDQPAGEAEYINLREQPISTRIKIEDLATYIENEENEEEAFKKEYLRLPSGLKDSHNEGLKENNRKKNRFVNIVPYDRYRVKLDEIDGDPDSTYINASFIKGLKEGAIPFIAAQGPRPNTVDDMWRMVWQYDANRIVMITNIYEIGRKKCEAYWPETVGSSLTYGQIQVKTEGIETFADYTIRIFLISAKGEDSRVVRQFHFTSWPDKSVPECAFPLLVFRRKFKSFDMDAVGPLIIHCSAGVGRTGTFLAIDYLAEQAHAEGHVDVFKCVQLMRTQRPNMVQTDEQYAFIYRALLELLTMDYPEIPCATFKNSFAMLEQPNKKTKLSPLSQQFEELSRFTAVKSDEEKDGLTMENKSKNRFSGTVPTIYETAEYLHGDSNRPYLAARGGCTSNYINAIVLPSYKKTNAFIITQMPLQNTIADIWRLILEMNSKTIVMLNELDEADPTCAQYWPDVDHPIQNYSGIEVELRQTEVNKNSTVVCRDFQVTYIDEKTDSKDQLTVRQFQLLSWKKVASLPEDKNSLLKLRDLVQRWQQQSGNSPVTLHCMNGVTRSGIFYTTCYTLEKMDIEQAVDIVLAVRNARQARPEIIENLAQYRFIHQLVEAYMMQFETYANFQ